MVFRQKGPLVVTAWLDSKVCDSDVHKWAARRHHHNTEEIEEWYTGRIPMCLFSCLLLS